MSVKYVIASLALVLLPSCASAQGDWWVVGDRLPSEQFVQACKASLDRTDVRVDVAKAPPVYRYDRSVIELTNAGRERRGKHRVLGLTEFQYALQGGANGTSLRDERTGMVCLRPTIRIVLKAEPQIVSVAREFPRGTCAHMAILDHEMRHVAVNDARIEHVGKGAQQGLSQYFGQRIFYGSGPGINQEISMRLEKEWFPWIHSQMDLTEHMHEQIDAPVEIARMSRVCGGEVQERLAYIP